jgi:dimethylaniline monooxygenase (N-oxide forming)
MLHDSGKFFDSITIFEKDTGLGGVWSLSRIYEGLTTNSPLLTYELPGFQFPPHIRSAGNHVSAQDVNSYLESYARCFHLTELIQFQTRVDKAEWEIERSVWVVSGISPAGNFQKSFGYIVVCSGLYHTGNIPLLASQTSRYTGKVFHSSEMGSSEARQVLVNSERVVVSGAGKSALDLATILARGKWTKKNVAVALVYRRPHWLSPRKILRGAIPFEKLLFCRFVVSNLTQDK